MTDYVIQANTSDFDARMQDKGGSKTGPALYAPQGKEEKAKGVEMRRCNACAAPSLCKQPAEKQGKKTRKRGKRLQRKRRNLTPLHMQDGGNDVCASAVDESVLSSMIYICLQSSFGSFRRVRCPRRAMHCQAPLLLQAPAAGSLSAHVWLARVPRRHRFLPP
jgi:hypothetical protein